MHTSIEMLDMVKAKYGLPSDYAAAKRIGVSTAAISRIRTKQHTFGVDQCLIIANLLEIDPLKVLSGARIEQLNRQTDQKYVKLWEQYA